MRLAAPMPSGSTYHACLLAYSSTCTFMAALLAGRVLQLSNSSLLFTICPCSFARLSLTCQPTGLQVPRGRPWQGSVWRPIKVHVDVGALLVATGASAPPWHNNNKHAGASRRLKTTTTHLYGTHLLTSSLLTQHLRLHLLLWPRNRACFRSADRARYVGRRATSV